jgi:hypothetical protein
MMPILLLFSKHHSTQLKLLSGGFLNFLSFVVPKVALGVVEHR